MLLYRDNAERLYLYAVDKCGLSGLSRYWLDEPEASLKYVRERCTVGEAVAVGAGLDGWVMWLTHAGDAGYMLTAIAPVDERVKAPAIGLHKNASGETRPDWLGWWHGVLKTKRKTNVFKVGQRLISSKPGPDGLARLAKVDSVIEGPEGGTLLRTVLLEEAGGPVGAGIADAWMPVFETRAPGFDALWRAGDTVADSYLILRTKLYNATARQIGRTAARKRR